MNKLVTSRHFIRILVALCVALILNYFISSTQQAWLPLATVIVMLTTTGSALYQGLLRFFVLASVVVIESLIFTSSHLLFIRMYDVGLGALIGIVINIIVLPDRVDFSCRNAFIPILQSYARYFSVLITALLQQDIASVNKEKIQVEKNLQRLPKWVYAAGFDLTLQKGYRYFFVKVGQMGELLLAMHHLARYPFSIELLNVIRGPLLECEARVQQFIAALISVLELKKITEGVVDFAAELAEIEEKFKAIVPTELAMPEVAKEYVYLTEFIYGLRDLRSILLRLGEALR